MTFLTTLALVLHLAVGCHTEPGFNAPTSDAKPVSHEIWDGLLKKYVDDRGLVNYAAFKANDANTLDRYLDLLSANAPAEGWSRDEKLAYWLNAYNAFTVKQILDKYPTTSIISSQLQLVAPGGPFSKKYFKIGGKEMSLNNIEHDIVRKQFNEPRIHFALVCAAVSCPKLRNEAYVPARLDAQLSDQARDFVNDPTKNVLARDRVSLSKLFDWYASDFGKSTGDVLRFINRFAGTTIDPSAKVSYLTYNWALNDQKTAR